MADINQQLNFAQFELRRVKYPVRPACALAPAPFLHTARR